MGRNRSRASGTRCFCGHMKSQHMMRACPHQPCRWCQCSYFLLDTDETRLELGISEEMVGQYRAVCLSNVGKHGAGRSENTITRYRDRVARIEAKLDQAKAEGPP